MASPILVTKLYIPSTRLELVLRPNLIKKLNTGLDRKLTLISAPAGFGKTTLLGEWLGSLQLINEKADHPEYKIAWLSLDEGDNEPARFLTYMIAALSRMEGMDAAFGKSELGMLQSPQPLPNENILTELINEITTISGKIIFILDDFHLVESQVIHDALTFFVENMPPQMHLVISSREDPFLPLSRLRARGQLNELRAAALRFSTTEATEFFNKVMGLDLTSEDVRALETRTEGWIAGLQLAAIALQGQTDPSNRIKTFTGSHRLVLDYLIEEVLNRQPENIQDFLLNTCVLKRMTGPLCDALTGQGNGQETLEKLEHANLFIVPLDDDRRWYRYHHLFAELLQQRVIQKDPDQLQILHLKASGWFEENGLMDEAVDHAFQTGEIDHAANLIEKLADHYFNIGQHLKLGPWLIKIPLEKIVTHPKLCTFYAWYHFLKGKQELAEKSLEVVEQELEREEVQKNEKEPPEQEIYSKLEKDSMKGRIAAVRTFMAGHRGDVAGIVKFARQGLEVLPEQDRIWRSLIALILGDVYGFKGDIPAAYEVRREAYEASFAAGDYYYAGLAGIKLAIALRSQAKLAETVEICKQQVQAANENGLSNSPMTGLLMLLWSEVLAEQNHLEEARSRLDKGVEITEHGTDVSFIGWGYSCTIRTRFASGDLEEIEELIKRMEAFRLKTNVPPWTVSQIEAWQMRLWLKQGNLKAAENWIDQRGLTTDSTNKPAVELTYFSLLDYLILARFRIAQGALKDAYELLDYLLDTAERCGRIFRKIEILMLQALTLQGQDKIDSAINKLETTLNIAEPEGFIRIFVDEGPPMAKLLFEALRRDISPSYVRQLLDAFPSEEPEKKHAVQSQNSEFDWIEPLSDREREVLQCIADGLTNQETAAKLFLSLNTVKAHTRNIYGKIGVNSRTQAIARARALGLLLSSES